VSAVYETVVLTEFEDIREQLRYDEDTVLMYLEFVERTWVGRRLGQTRKAGLFPISSWNHYNTFLTGIEFILLQNLCILGLQLKLSLIVGTVDYYLYYTFFKEDSSED
jgi:hypothetical protein